MANRRRIARIGALMADVARRDAERARRSRWDDARRDRHVVTVTLCKRDDGTQRTVVRESGSMELDGGTLAMLREAVGAYDPAEWRVQSISTPASILADLRGRKPGLPTSMEASMLARAGLTAYR